MKDKLRKFNCSQRALVQGVNKWFDKGDVVEYLHHMGGHYALVKDHRDSGQYVVPMASLSTMTEQEIKECGIELTSTEDK